MAIILIGGTDTETTGFVETEHRIIEACVKVYRFNTDTLHATLRGQKTWRWNPLRSIPAKAFAVHKISESDLAGEPTWEQTAHEYASILGKCDVVVAHNGMSFDFPFIIQELDRIKHPLPDFIPFDTMREGRWATARGESPSLKKLCFACDVEYDTSIAHAADYDVDVMMQCFFFGVQQGWFKPQYQDEHNVS
jgi:DNA polymerase-3 subunit epsilon